MPQTCVALALAGEAGRGAPPVVALRGRVWVFVLLPSVSSREAWDCQCYADAALTYARLSPPWMTHLMKGGRGGRQGGRETRSERKSHLSWPGSSAAKHISTTETTVSWQKKRRKQL